MRHCTQNGVCAHAVSRRRTTIAPTTDLLDRVSRQPPANTAPHRRLSHRQKTVGLVCLSVCRYSTQEEQRSPKRCANGMLLCPGRRFVFTEREIVDAHSLTHSQQWRDSPQQSACLDVHKNPDCDSWWEHLHQRHLLRSPRLTASFFSRLQLRRHLRNTQITSQNACIRREITRANSSRRDICNLKHAFEAIKLHFCDGHLRGSEINLT